MTIWQLLASVLVAGGIGGVVNSLVNDKGLVAPYMLSRGDGSRLFVPGCLGNILVGASAAGVSWLLYGPLGQGMVGVSSTATLNLAALGSAVLVGMSGSGWLTNAVDKKILKVAVAQAAQAPASAGVTQQILQSSTAQVLKLAQQINTHVGSGNRSTTP